MKQLFFIAALIYEVICSANSESITLKGLYFENPQGYNDSVASLVPGKILEFSSLKFKILSVLTGGNTTKILRVARVDGTNERSVILRIPPQSGFFREIPYLAYLNMFIQNHRLLSKTGFVPSMYFFALDEFAIVEEVNPDVSMVDFVFKPDSFSKRRLKEMEKGIREFAKAMAPFRRIGDLRMDQVFYDQSQKKWFLLDWTETKLLDGKVTPRELFAENCFDMDFLEKTVLQFGSRFGNRLRMYQILLLMRNALVSGRIDMLQKGHNPISGKIFEIIPDSTKIYESIQHELEGRQTILQKCARILGIK
ncbi:MAG: hypothetical protein IPJ71_00290 [Bdellovibrionales bacterium]|nr:hypothetical protein [Bdellovibrionales bacterium]